ncbi:hypothetical protein PVK06_026433 [Gossypium arboreum]|uniref:Uncharacterized protein n=1 Tax=Gossypium arboreum TaxID=29729 RepID=A0ABR0NY02_GOSAR|nr:hypothetical protein PVK06_026433 [Gossypium arboreum]
MVYEGSLVGARCATSVRNALLCVPWRRAAAFKSNICHGIELVKSLEAAAIPATWVLESKDVPMSKLPWEVDAIIHASRS